MSDAIPISRGSRLPNCNHGVAPGIPFSNRGLQEKAPQSLVARDSAQEHMLKFKPDKGVRAPVEAERQVISMPEESDDPPAMAAAKASP